MSLSSLQWLEYANHNPDYANWLERIDTLCDRLLDVRFADLIELADFDPLETYQRGIVRPERYVVEYVIPYLQTDHGADTIFEVIAENVLWGITIHSED